MATRTSVGTGNWSVAGTWNTGVPVDTDDFVIAAGHTVTFDVDQSAMGSGMGASTIAATGTLICDTTAGDYYLKMNGDLTVNGTLQAGTSIAVPLPSGTTFTIDFDSNAKGIVSSATGVVNFYCTQPTNKWAKLSAQEAAGQTTLSIDTDLTSDWSTGAVVRICDVDRAAETEWATIDAIRTAPNEIDIDIGDSGVPTGLAAQKESGAYVVLVTRNIRVINSTNIAFGGSSSSNAYLACEFTNNTYTVNEGDGHEMAGVINTGGWSTSYVDNLTISGVIVAGTYGGIYNKSGSVSGLIVGCTTGFNGCDAVSITGTITGCNNACDGVRGCLFTSTSEISDSGTGIYRSQGCYVYGTIDNCSQALIEGGGHVLSATLTNNSSDLYTIQSLVAYNTLFGGTTEFSGYDSVQRAKSHYAESFDHDQTTNAFKAWCRGGTVTSQTASPPTGYTIWYEFTAEDTTQTYSVFRQYETTVQAGTAIEVEGVLRNDEAGLDLTGNEPFLAIADKFADPLVDSTQSYLDIDYIPEPDADTENGWQDVSVIWSNSGDSARQVIVRMAVEHDGGGNDVVVDGAWSIADYKDQINDILTAVRPLSTTVSASDTATSFTLTAGEATADAYNNMLIAIQDADDDHWEERTITDWTAGRVVTVDTAFSFTPAVDDVAWVKGCGYGGPVDLTSITDKLPTNYIMGSSDQDNHDTDIDAILADTGTDGVVLADDAITSAKYDETTAFAIESVDSGATQIARTGADGDTLETLSDQLDTVETNTDTIIANTGKVVNVYPSGEKRTITGGATVGVEDEKE